LVSSTKTLTVAVTMRVVQAEGYVEPRDAVSHDWVRFLCSLNLRVLLIPNALLDPVAFFESHGPDALLLTNGDDVGPDPDERVERKAAGETVEEASRALRDGTERKLLNFAMTSGVPVMGACRGFQLINAALGGRDRLVSDVSAPADSHVTAAHPVDLSGLFEQLAGRPGAQVNSYHRRAVLDRDLAPRLVPCARAHDGVVEAYVHDAAAVWGIQWHPERPNPAAELDRRIIAVWLGRGADAQGK
jgi:N5-(cytidine 5'-diphosphoramidyl)-L-glutamine hydrolase